MTPTFTPQPDPPAEPEYRGPYWTRPLAWDAQGSLIYMRILCASSLVQDYQIYRWQAPKRSDMLGSGQSKGSVEKASFSGDGLAYVVTSNPSSGPRSPASLWIWDLAKSIRGRILDTERGVSALDS